MSDTATTPTKRKAELLAARFPISDIRTREGSWNFKTQTREILVYVPQDIIVQRFIDVMGFDWSCSYSEPTFRTIPTKIRKGYGDNKQELIEDHQWAFIKAKVEIKSEDGSWYSKEGYGSEDVERAGGGPDMAIKSAQSSAFKKAATYYGNSLYLYDQTERDFILQKIDLIRNSPVTKEQKTEVWKLCGEDHDQLTDLLTKFSRGWTIYPQDLDNAQATKFIEWLKKQQS